MTLVIDPEATPVPTWATALDVANLDAAIEALGRRERIPEARWASWIGGQTLTHPEDARGEALPAIRSEIGAWLPGSAFEAVVWTALPSRRPDGEFARPSGEALVEHLSGLSGEARVRAEEYIRRAPTMVRTARRMLFESALGWTPSDAAPNAPTPGVPEAPPNAPTPEEGAGRRGRTEVEETR